MSRPHKRLAVFPGTFDPITNGHLDVIRRGAKLFDELIVAVGDNPEKAALLDRHRRARIAAEATADMPNVRVETYSGLTVDFAARARATVILRGIRNSADLRFEYQVALTNRLVAGIETVFIVTATEHAFISSSLIRQIARMGGDVSAMVPAAVLEHLCDLTGAPARDNALDEPQ